MNWITDLPRRRCGRIQHRQAEKLPKQKPRAARFDEFEGDVLVNDARSYRAFILDIKTLVLFPQNDIRKQMYWRLGEISKGV